jgi:predicted nucleotidyltransferase
LHAEIANRRDAIGDLCRRFGVSRLEVFGSAARGEDFDPAKSDADFLVEFASGSGAPAFRRREGLAKALEKLLGRHVDLVRYDAIENPYIRASVERSRQVVYGA